MRRLRRVIAHPAFALLVFALLVIDFLSIPSTNWQRSSVSYAVFGNRNPSTAHGRPLPGVACNTPDGVVWVWVWTAEHQEKADAGELEPIPGPGPFIGMSHQRGFYHMTKWSEEIRFPNVHLVDGGRDALIDAIVAASDHPDVAGAGPPLSWVFETLASRRTAEARPIYSGYARNGIALALLGLLACSLLLNPPWRWVLALHRTFVEDREHQRRWSGLCPGCAYPMKGLDRCPECGRAVRTE